MSEAEITEELAGLKRVKREFRYGVFKAAGISFTNARVARAERRGEAT